MHTYDFIINHRRAGEAFKCVTELFPQFNTVPTAAFIVKPVYTIDAGAFVISA